MEKESADEVVRLRQERFAVVDADPLTLARSVFLEAAREYCRVHESGAHEADAHYAMTRAYRALVKLEVRQSKKGKSK